VPSFCYPHVADGNQLQLQQIHISNKCIVLLLNMMMMMMSNLYLYEDFDGSINCMMIYSCFLAVVLKKLRIMV
jgi:hypothetical protein